MLGTGLQTGRVRGEDRFYIPLKARKNQSQNQLQKQKRVQSVKTDGKESSIASTEAKVVASEDKNPQEPPNLPPSEPLITTCSSNLSRFLESTTPSVAAQYLSKMTMRGWRTCDVEFQPYFILGDLWESFKEWSAYGAGVPLILDGSDTVVQYYVPYLSGIQLYGKSKRTAAKSRQASEDSDGDLYRDSSSDGSSDYETEKGTKCFRDRQGHQHLMSLGMDTLSLSDNIISTQDGFSSDEGETENSRSHLLFEFLEQDLPYSREPLAEKISDLSCHYPELMTLRSCDLLPVSWISVAWYPIYRIPMGPTLRDLDACFLTYHSLSTTIEGSGNVQAPVVVYPSDIDGVPRISLPVFGMACYKFRGAVWIQNEDCELQRANTLTQAADNWLGLLQANHPDFQFFTSHGTYYG